MMNSNFSLSSIYSIMSSVTKEASSASNDSSYELSEIRGSFCVDLRRDYFFFRFYSFGINRFWMAVLTSSASKMNENVEPDPIVDLHLRSPFKHLAMFLLMLSPSPLPLGFIFLLFWSVVLKKGSKSLVYSSSEIPMP